ncbi:MAG: C-GCAxxG-C-C family protein [Flavobacteriales bacterium]|nr:C-GCAxxG-C-C family protein [Flavobacteriales bacterium]
MEQRIQKAVEYFKNGYNCSQSVTAAFADVYGLSEEQALRISASFGGGIGRTRNVCGAACGMFILAGLETGSITPKDNIGKENNYKVVRTLTDKYIQEAGALRCAVLLGLETPRQDEMTNPEALAQKHTCAQKVETAARIFAQYLTSQGKKI